MNEEEIRAATVGEPKVHDGTIDLADYDPAWPDLFTRESDRIRSTLGNVARALEHVGSTSVPGLAAKPIIDIVLVVSDSANEAAYVPALEAIGYVLRIREPDWYEHRMLARNEPSVQIHVFSEGCPEIERMLALPKPTAREHGRPRPLRAHQAPAGRQDVEVRPELRGCEDRGRQRHHRSCT